MTLSLVGKGYEPPHGRWIKDPEHHLDESAEVDANDDSQKLNAGNVSSKAKNLLKSALTHASPDMYTEALYLEKYRDALLEQANLLQANIDEEFESHAKFLAPRVYGWAEDEEMQGITSRWQKLKNKIQLNRDQSNSEQVFKILRRMETQAFLLEDKHVSDKFFEDIKTWLIKDDIKDINPEILNKNYPWLMITPQEEYAIDVFRHELLEKKKQRKASKERAKQKELEKKEPKTFISRTKFQNYMAEKEKELEKELQNQFKANPIPASSIMPKSIDLTLGTRLS